MSRRVRNRRLVRLTRREVHDLDLPDVGVDHREADVGEHPVAGADGEVRDLEDRSGDDLPPCEVASVPGRVDVLAAPRLDQRRVDGQAVLVDASAADADPVPRVLVRSRVEARRRYRPGAGDLVVELAAVGDEAKVVARPVRGLAGRTGGEDAAGMELPIGPGDRISDRARV